jgi:hypothetical protein
VVLDCKADGAGRVAQRHVVRGINIVGDLEIPSSLRLPRDDHIHWCKELCGVPGKKSVQMVAVVNSPSSAHP